MQTIHPQYLIDKNGKKSSVLLSIKDFKSILQDLEMIEDIALYDQTKNEENDFIEANIAFELIEQKKAI